MKLKSNWKPQHTKLTGSADEGENVKILWWTGDKITSSLAHVLFPYSFSAYNNINYTDCTYKFQNNKSHEKQTKHLTMLFKSKMYRNIVH